MKATIIKHVTAMCLALLMASTTGHAQSVVDLTNARAIPGSEKFMTRPIQLGRQCIEVVGPIYSTETGMKLNGKAQYIMNKLISLADSGGGKVDFNDPEGGMIVAFFPILLPLMLVGIAAGMFATVVAGVLMVTDVVGKTPVALFVAYKECGK